MELSIDLLRELISCLDASNLDVLHLETDGFKISLERRAPQASGAAASAAPAAPAAETAPAAKAPDAAPAKEAGTVVKSPIVGTYYGAASPDKPAFAAPGKAVKKGDTLFIVESMKLMNEVASECDGTVAEIYVKDGQPVEYGQKIMRIV